MTKRITIALFPLLLFAQSAWCDWDHSSSSSGPPDPGFDAFMVTTLIIIAASLAILLFAGPILVTRTRRIRDLFWIVPLVNIVLYIVSISLQNYPGGFAARYQPPGLENTVLEIILLLLSSLIVAGVIAVIRWVIRTKKMLTDKWHGDSAQP